MGIKYTFGEWYYWERPSAGVADKGCAKKFYFSRQVMRALSKS
jgi:hypothetical protein